MKYTPDQLREMAKTALCARANNDDRWRDLVLALVIRTLLPPHIVIQRIEALATD